MSFHCDVDKRSFSESGQGWRQKFSTFFITSTGKPAIIFSDWNLNKHSRDYLCKRIALD